MRSFARLRFTRRTTSIIVGSALALAVTVTVWVLRADPPLSPIVVGTTPPSESTSPTPEAGSPSKGWTMLP
ncbi:MAG: hypothetical protein ACRDKS_11775, partial [Actinomycetota bacterium]